MKRLRTRLRPIVLGLAVVCAGISLTAHAGEGPMVIGRHEKPPILTLDPFSGSLGVNMVMENDSSTTGGNTTRSSSTLFEERLSLTTGGSIVTRNFIDWHASGSFGMSEEFSHSTSQNTSSFALLHAYDLQATLLRTSDLPLSMYARRSENFLTRSFSPMLKSTTTDYGSTLSYRSPIAPTTLSISRTETTQAQLDGSAEYHLNQNNLSLNSEWAPTDRQQLTLSYDFSQVEQTSEGLEGDKYNTQNLSLMHQWAFDDQSQSMLTSTLNYNSQSGKFAFDHLRIGEQLRLHHTDYLESSINYTFDDQKYVNVESRSHQINAGVTHRLFDSLTTTGQVGGSMVEQTFGNGGGATNTSTFGNVNVDYRKKVPLGNFNASAGVGYNKSNNGEITQSRQIFNDIQNFADPAPVILTRTGIDPASLVVQNAAGTRTFAPGTDYTVQQVGNTLQVLRQVGGNIDDGDTVRLNYKLAPLPGYTSTTTSLNLNLRYDFTEGPLVGLGFFARYAQQDQDIQTSGRSSLLIADNVRDTIVGSDYRIWKLTFHAEKESRESELTPLEATRFSARYSDRLGDHTPISISVNKSYLNYPNSGTVDFTSVDARIEHELNKNLRASASVRWRDDNDSRFGHTMGFEEQGELRYRLRQTEMYIMIRHTSLEASASEADSLVVQCGLTRNF